MVDKEQELCKAIGREMMKAVDSLRNEDYDFNEEQWAKYRAVEEYAKTLAEQNGGTIEGTTSHQTKWSMGAVGVRFKGEITFGEQTTSMEAFRKAIELCDGFEVFGTGLDDGSFILSFYVLNMNVPKPKAKILKPKRH